MNSYCICCKKDTKCIRREIVKTRNKIGYYLDLFVMFVRKTNQGFIKGVPFIFIVKYYHYYQVKVWLFLAIIIVDMEIHSIMENLLMSPMLSVKDMIIVIQNLILINMIVTKECLMKWKRVSKQPLEETYQSILLLKLKYLVNTNLD